MISEELQNDAPSDEIAVSNKKQNGKESESKRDQNESPVDDNGCGCWSITKQCIQTIINYHYNNNYNSTPLSHLS